MQRLADTYLDQRTDYIPPKTNFTRSFDVLIPSKEDWAVDSVQTDDAISVFTDGSKMGKGDRVWHLL